jgi:PTS system mannose-specific IIA component
MLGLVLVGHDPLGKTTLEILSHIMGSPPEALVVVDVKADDPVEFTVLRIQEAAKDVNQGEGVVFLVDLFGATPSNAAVRAGSEGLNMPSVLVAGCNLPMLLRALSYRCLPIGDVAEKLAAGGRNGIVSMGLTSPQQQQTYHLAPRYDSTGNYDQQ